MSTDHHDPGLAPEPDRSPPLVLTVVVIATLCLMFGAIITLIPIVTGTAETLEYEKDLSVSNGELEELRVREDNQLLRSNTLDDGTKTLTITNAKAALADDPSLLTDAFGAPAAPEPVVLEEGMSEEDAALIATGQGLYLTKTCMACHSLDGNRTVGPTFKGLWGTTHNLTDGTSVTVDDAYFAQSVKDPMSQIAEGFPAAMPPLGLTDDEIAALAAYVKTLK